MNRNIRKIAAVLSLSVSLMMIGQPAFAESFTPLKKGTRGKQVLAVEKMLAALNFDDNLKVDKSYTATTAKNVKKFQKKYKLKQTGIVDKKTYQKLKQEYAKQQKKKKQESQNSQKPDSSSKPQTGTPARPSSPSQPAAPQKPDAQVPLPSGLTADEKNMIELVNKERANRGLSPLQVDMKLEDVARTKAQDMVNNHYFSHNSPTYGSPFQMMKSFGINYQAAAENIAQNRTVEAGHEMLMNSSGHRANILNPSFTHVAIAVVDGGNYGKTFVQMFVKK